MDLHVDALVVGMVVTADVAGARGRVLIRAGTSLEDKHLRALKKWGVRKVSIDADKMSASELPSGPADEAAQRADEVFQHTDREHPIVAALYDEFLRRAAVDPKLLEQ